MQEKGGGGFLQLIGIGKQMTHQFENSMQGKKSRAGAHESGEKSIWGGEGIWIGDSNHSPIHPLTHPPTHLPTNTTNTRCWTTQGPSCIYTQPGLSLSLSTGRMYLPFKRILPHQKSFEKYDLLISAD